VIVESSSSFEAVELRGVAKSYGRVAALRPLDLRVEAGRACVLLGSNGAGKSTLLGILGTLLHPTAGEVRYGSLRPADGARLRSQIGVCSHSTLCYGDLSGRENLALFGRLYGVADPSARAAELLDRVALGAAADRPARTYSRGMAQRLSIARALVHSPRLLLLDEPFSGLDRESAAAVAALLSDQARGQILVLATHDFDAAAGLGRHAVVLRGGRLRAERRSDEPLSGTELRALYEGSSA
jgi:ABC-type multidrug transport system ATPase subunit